MAEGILSVVQRKEIRASFAMGSKAYGQNEWYKIYARIFTGGIHGGPKSSDSAYEEIGFMVGLKGILKKDNIFDPAPEITAPEPQLYRIYHEVYDAAFSYYRDVVKNDKLGWYKMVAASLGEARMYTRELVGHELFNRSGDATFKQGWDDLPLASNVHRLLNGNTYNNTIVATAPTETLLGVITAYFDNVPDHQGRVGAVSGLTIYTSRDNYRLWQQLIRAVNKDLALTNPVGGGANANPAMPNIYNGDGFTVVGTPYLYGTNKHIVVGPKHGFFWFDRERREQMIPKYDPDRETMIVRDELSKGCSDPRQVLVIG